MKGTSKGKDAAVDSDADVEAADVEEKETSQDETEATTDTGEKTTPTELSNIQKENRRLRGQISTLQQQIDKIKVAFVGDDTQKGEVTVEQMQQDIAELRKDLQAKDAELRKNTFIDGLKDVTEARKRELKRRVAADTDNIEQSVKDEIAALDALIQEETQQQTGEDSRPASEGGVSVQPTQDARKILEDKDLYRKTWGLD